ncbi:MAG: HepT-like ribonuclease domain-containing protein [Anaerolineae bacterium]
MWRDDAYLLDMLLAAKEARAFSADLSWDEFQRSSLHQHAIAKALENIGEAARKISDEAKAVYAAVPWDQIIGLRHRIAHDYFHLDLVRIWEIVQRDIPVLIEILEPLVPPEEP